MARAARGEDIEEFQSRDENGWLIRIDEATEQDLDAELTIIVDGTPLTVHKARLATDSQGNPLKDAEGRPKIRATTILDAIRAATNVGEVLRDEVASVLGSQTATDSPNVVLKQILQVGAERGGEYAFLQALIRHAEADAMFARDEPHKEAARFRLDRFRRGAMIDEKGQGPQPNLH